MVEVVVKEVAASLMEMAVAVWELEAVALAKGAANSGRTRRSVQTPGRQTGSSSSIDQGGTRSALRME